MMLCKLTIFCYALPEYSFKCTVVKTFAFPKCRVVFN